MQLLALLALMPAVSAQDFPRIANLWGCGPTATNYDEWARYDLLVMAGGAPADYRAFRAQMATRNPGIRLLGTGPLMNLGPPANTPWMREEWYVHRPSGELVNWWAGQIYTPNLLIDECLDTLVEQTVRMYGEVLEDHTLDGVFYDSVVGRASWLGEVDLDRNGVADVPADIDPEWQARQNLFFDRLKEQYPGLLIVANDVDAGHAAHLNGRLFEGAPLLDRILGGTLSPRDAARELDAWMTTSLQPGLTFAIMTQPTGWQGWRVGKGDKVTTPGEVDRARRDFARMRTGLCTALMSDAFYAYDFGTVWYGLPLWYAEYDAPLGQPLGPAREVEEVPPVPVFEWRAGQPATGLVLDGAARETPEGIVGETAVDGGWQRLFGTDFRRVPLEPGKRYRVTAQCTILAKPTKGLQFNVRTGKGGWEHHDKGVVQNAADAGTVWSIDVTVTPDDFEDYSAEWHLLGAGGVRLERLRIELVGESYFVRDFAGGSVLLNNTPYPITVELREPLRRLRDDEAPRHVVEVDDGGSGYTSEGAWEFVAGEEHYCGPGFRVAAKPGDTARWTFTAPSTDTYTLFVTAPGGKRLTDAAAYSCGGRTATVNQRRGDGGWAELFSVDLQAGERCEVTLTSGGEGATAADALRAESAARYNDGSEVRTLALGPYDGVVLLKP